MTLKILAVLPGFSGDGSCRMLADVLCRLDRAQFTPAVLSLSDSVTFGERKYPMEGDCSYKQLQRAGIAIQAFRRCYDPASGDDYQAAQLLAARELLRQVDVVISPDEALGFLSMISEPQRIVAFLQRPKPTERLTECIRAGKVVLCIVPSNAAKMEHEAVGIPADMIRLIPNGADSTLYRFDEAARRKFRNNCGIPLKAKVIGCVAHNSPGKNLSLFFEAAALCVLAEPLTHILACGHGMTMPDVLPYINPHFGAGHRALDRIHCVGMIQDMASLYAAVDVVAVTSTMGSYPLCLAEAVLCGNIPVVTAVGDAGDATLNCGHLISSFDALSIVELWGTAYEILRQRKHLPAKADERFDIANVALRYAEAIKSAAAI